MSIKDIPCTFNGRTWEKHNVVPSDEGPAKLYYDGVPYCTQCGTMDFESTDQEIRDRRTSQ